MQLENWLVIENNDPYVPPELKDKRLQGNVYGHPRFEDGKWITTSSLVELDVVAGTAKTFSGSEYTLGTIDPEYDEWNKARLV